MLRAAHVHLVCGINSPYLFVNLILEPCSFLQFLPIPSPITSSFFHSPLCSSVTPFAPGLKPVYEICSTVVVLEVLYFFLWTAVTSSWTVSSAGYEVPGLFFVDPFFRFCAVSCARLRWHVVNFCAHVQTYTVSYRKTIVGLIRFFF